MTWTGTLTMRQLVVGCDLSRAFLDLCDLPSDRLQRLPNTRDAIANWAETLTSETLTVFEASSGCNNTLIAALTECAHPLSRINPRQAREFARATGVLDKTDRVDARVLTQMGAALDLPIIRPVLGDQRHDRPDLDPDRNPRLPYQGPARQGPDACGGGRLDERRPRHRSDRVCHSAR